MAFWPAREGMYSVRSLKLRGRQCPEECLDIHDGIFLLSDEIADGYYGLVAPVRLAHLERRVYGGPLLVEGGGVI